MSRYDRSLGGLGLSSTPDSKRTVRFFRDNLQLSTAAGAVLADAFFGTAIDKTTAGYDRSLGKLGRSTQAYADGFNFGRITRTNITGNAVVSTAFFGYTTTVIVPPQDMVSPGVDTAEAFGSAQLNLFTYAPGIDSAFAAGTPRDVKKTVAPSIPSGYAFGTPKFGRQYRPDGIASGFASGTSTITVGTLDKTIQATGLATANAFGTSKTAFTAYPTGITSGFSAGNATYVQTIQATGLAASDAYGSSKISFKINAFSLASDFAAGTAQLNFTITGIGLDSDFAAGTSDVTNPGPLQEIVSEPIDSSADYGNSEVSFGTYLQGIDSDFDYGLALLSLNIVSNSIESEFVTGDSVIIVDGQAQTIQSEGIDSGFEAGTADIKYQVKTESSGGRFIPTPIILSTQEIRSFGIESSTSFGMGSITMSSSVIGIESVSIVGASVINYILKEQEIKYTAQSSVSYMQSNIVRSHGPNAAARKGNKHAKI